MPIEEDGPVPEQRMTPKSAGEWVRLGLGIACILHQLVWVSFGKEPILLVWSGGLLLLTGLALSLAGGRGGGSS